MLCRYVLTVFVSSFQMNCWLVAPIHASHTERDRERASSVDSSQPHLTQNVYTSIMMRFANNVAIW